MGARHRWQAIPLAVKLLVVGAVMIAALILLKPRPEPRPAVERPLPEVKVVFARPQTLALNVTAQGTVLPRRQIDVVSQVSGRITAVAPAFVDGGFFAADDWLVQIDERDYRYALIQADANVADAQRALTSERGLARQAQREWRDLGNADANDLFLRKPQIAAAEALLAAARAQRDQAQLNLERTRITAPFNGRINETFVDLGQFVTAGTRVASIYDAAIAEVRIALTDLQALLIDLPINNHPAATPVTLTGTIAGETYHWQGQMTRTEASLDPQSRMYQVIVEIAEPFNRERHPVPLLMGMYVTAEISGRALDNIIRLPKTAVFRRDQVYTLNAEQQVQVKTVQVLRSDDQFVWIRGTIADGEAVVLERQGYLNPGITVAITKPTTAAPEVAP
ncbi:efflux RND transporter periplasmic adaptor subunit [Cellvibrio sp. ARAG 10.3]|uniref:efflux RND transporter periplasmic adaptor subunit n=1 Tax=Cellvibrio sp. ARAG 10.3 TaxID=3451358 RepID=UPI003F4570C3